MSNEKGGLIKKKPRKMQPAPKVSKPDQFNAFSYTPQPAKAEATKEEVKPKAIAEPEVKQESITEPEKKVEETSSEPEVKTETEEVKDVVIIEQAPKAARRSQKLTLEDLKNNLTVGRGTKSKSVRAPEFVYDELVLLSSFVDENKMYQILQMLIDSYVSHELTPRQQRQFNYMMELKFLKEEEETK